MWRIPLWISMLIHDGGDRNDLVSAFVHEIEHLGLPGYDCLDGVRKGLPRHRVIIRALGEVTHDLGYLPVRSTPVRRNWNNPQFWDMAMNWVFSRVNLSRPSKGAIVAFCRPFLFIRDCLLGLETKEGLKLNGSLCDRIRETSLALHRYLRHGPLEKVYENGLAHRLRKLDPKVIQQHSLTVCDEDGMVLGEYLADLFIEDCLIVELKACKNLANEHIAQLLNYLRACGIEHGLLVNFGAPKLEIRKYAFSQP